MPYSRNKIWINWLSVIVIGSVCALVLAAQQPAKKLDDAALRNSGKTGEEWLTYGLNYAETRYSPLKQIDSTNVNRLGPAWSYDIPGGGGNQEATPLVWHDTIYGVTNWSVTFAVDARTGKEKWRWDPQVVRANVKACCGIVNRGIGIYEAGRDTGLTAATIFVPVIDGRLAALDAETGHFLWAVQTTPPDQPYTMTMAPRVAKGKVIVGNAGAEYPVRGYVSAYDVNHGKLMWRFYTVPGDPAKGFENDAMKKAAATWSGEWYKYGGGGTVWDGMSYDPEAELVYFGTGNGGPWPEQLRQSKGKDNLYIASVLALKVDTGEYKWHYQFVPGDSWDFDSVQQLTLADLRINGRERKVIMQANKNGFFYVLDRLNGDFISAQPFAYANWASGMDPKTGRPLINPDAYYGATQVSVSPGPGGAHNWAPMSFNPTTGLMYIPTTTTSSSNYAVDTNFVYNPAGMNFGLNRGGGGRGGGGGGAAPGAGPGPVAGAGAPGAPPAAAAGPAAPGQPAGALPGAGAPPAAGGGAARGGAGAGGAAPPAVPTAGPMIGPDTQGQRGGALVAWNPITQKEVWRVLGGGGGGGGTVTTAGNLVLQTLTNGRLLAFSADKGEKLLELETGLTGGSGPPITYLIDGKQYVTVMGNTAAGGGRGGAGAGPGAPPAPGANAPAGAPPAGVPPAGAPAAGGRGAAAPAGPPAPGAPAAPPVPGAPAQAAAPGQGGAAGAGRGGNAAPASPPRMFTFVLDGKAAAPAPRGQ